MTPREVLLRAADHMEKYGWRQRRRGMRGEPCCAIGAIAAAIPDSEPDDALEMSARAALRRHARIDDIPAWNDAPDRTAAEVIAALRGAAEVSA